MNYILPNWPAPPQIKAYTTVRNGWGKRALHHDLHGGNFIPNHPEYIEESRRLEELLNLPNQPIWITQTHSTHVVEACSKNQAQLADASFTNKTKQICIVMTADCLPILICHRQASHVAAIHAGWRGLANGIIEATLDALNCPPEELLVWFGPAIGPEKFEVGKDVYDAFISKHEESSSAFKPQTEGKWLANLYELATIRLRLRGICNTYGGQFCTYSQPDLFFSYRRDRARTGSMASLIWIDENS